MEITKTKIEIKTGGSPLSFEGFLARYSNATKKLVKSHLSGFFTFMALNGWALSDTNQDIINIYMNELRESGIKNAPYFVVLGRSVTSLGKASIGAKDFFV